MLINIFVLIIYFLVITFFVQQKSNNQIQPKWWQVSISIVAAETSALTFVSLPGIAFAGNLNFLQLALGYILGRVFIAFILLPKYKKNQITTAYTFIGQFYGNLTQKFLSIIFLFTKLLADSVRLYATSIPIKLLFNIDYHYSIIAITILTILYVIFSGFSKLLKLDAYQKLLFLFTALLSIIILYYQNIENINNSIIHNIHKFNIFDFNIDKFFTNPYNFYSSVIGGAILSIATHGTDQSIVQRLLSIINLKNSQKSIILSGILVFFQFYLFLMIGVLLSFLYVNKNIKPDEIFIMFVINKIPVGISGLIIAGVIASALSSLGASINGMVSSLTNDLYKNLNKKFTFSQIVVIISIVLTLLAFWISSTKQSVIEIALRIISITYSGILGIFILALLNTKLSSVMSIISISCGILLSAILYFLNIVAWTWLMPIGVTCTIIVGILINNFVRGEYAA